MKKLLLISTLLYLFSADVYSSHLYGGDIHFEQIGVNQYILKLRMAHDTLGSSLTSLNFNIFENNTDSVIGNVN